MGDEITSLPGTSAIRPTDRELPQRDRQGSARRRDPGPKRPGPTESAAHHDGDEGRQVGTKLDVKA